MYRFFVSVVFAVSVTEFAGFALGDWMPAMLGWDTSPSTHAMLALRGGHSATWTDFMFLTATVVVTCAGLGMHYVAWDNARWWLCGGENVLDVVDPLDEPGMSRSTIYKSVHPIQHRWPIVIALAIVTLAFGVLSGFAYESDIAMQGAFVAALGWLAIVFKK